jgi:hypothetical protein
MDISQLKKLDKLNQLRVKRYEKQMAEKKVLYIDACEKVEQRNNEINNIKIENGDLNGYLKQDHVSCSPTKREYVHIRRFWLNYDLEMHEFYYTQEVDDKNNAQLKYDNSRQLWHKQKLKTEKLSKIHKSTSIEQNMKVENTEDEDNQESILKQD